MNHPWKTVPIGTITLFILFIFSQENSHSGHLNILPIWFSIILKTSSGKKPQPDFISQNPQLG